MAFNVSFTSCFNLVQLSGKLPEMLSLNFIILHLHEITTQSVSNYIISWEPDFLSLFFFDIQQRFRVGIHKRIIIRDPKENHYCSHDLVLFLKVWGVNAWVLKHFFCYLLFSCCFGTSFPSSFKSFILENPWTNSVSHWLLLLTVFLFWFLLNFGAVHLSLFWCCSFLWFYLVWLVWSVFDKRSVHYWTVLDSLFCLWLFPGLCCFLLVSCFKIEELDQFC